MILEFSFSSISNSGILENILHNILHKIIHKYPIQGSLVSEKNRSYLYISGDEEPLKNFSDEFSASLPYSLFFTFLEAKVVEDFPKSSPLPSCKVNIPFTHAMIEEVLEKRSENYYNPFLKADFGETLKIKPPLVFLSENEQIKAEKSEEFHEVIQKAALHVKEGNSLHVNTKSGKKSLKIVNENSLKELGKSSFWVMPCDLSLVEKAFIATKEEIHALASLEKPTLNLRVNLIYKNKNFLPTSWVDVKMSDSLLLFLLAKELFRVGVEFISLEENEKADISLTHFQDRTKKPLKVNVLENKAIIMLDKNEFEATQALPTFKEKSHEKFTSIIYEYNLFEEKSSCFYLSKTNDDKIMTYSQKLGLIELVNIEIPLSIEDILIQIENIDEGGAKLVRNYKKEYSKVIEKALHVKVSKDAPKSFYTLLGVVGVVLGFGDDVKSAADTLLRYAKEFAGPKGPRIDVKMHNNGFPETLDVVKFVRSGLSFRLAGVDNEILSYGYLESIAYFVSDVADIIAKEFETTHVCLSGSLFSFKRVLETSAKNIQPNHKVCINRAFALDD